MGRRESSADDQQGAVSTSLETRVGNRRVVSTTTRATDQPLPGGRGSEDHKSHDRDGRRVLPMITKVPRSQRRESRVDDSLGSLTSPETLSPYGAKHPRGRVTPPRSAHERTGTPARGRPEPHSLVHHLAVAVDEVQVLGRNTALVEKPEGLLHHQRHLGRAGRAGNDALSAFRWFGGDTRTTRRRLADDMRAICGRHGGDTGATRGRHAGDTGATRG